MEETTIFREAFGDSPVIRVIDFMIEGRNLDYSLTDIAENAGIGWTTLHRIWDNLVRLEIVKHTRVIGKARLFRLNTESDVVRRMISVYDALLLQENKKALSQKIKVHN